MSTKERESHKDLREFLRKNRKALSFGAAFSVFGFTLTSLALIEDHHFLVLNHTRPHIEEHSLNLSCSQLNKAYKYSVRDDTASMIRKAQNEKGCGVPNSIAKK